MDVWVIETGDYEDRYVMGVASSVEAAEAFVKSTFPPPYVGEWELKRLEPVAIYPDKWVMLSRLERVPDYSTKHVGQFDFTRYEVQGD